MIIQKKKRLKMIIQQQEAKIERMKNAIHACCTEEKMVDFVVQRCHASEQVDSVMKHKDGYFVITVFSSYNGNGLTETIQFYGYTQDKNGTFFKSHMLHSHFIYHKTYHVLEYVELCSNCLSSQDDSLGNPITEAFLAFMRRLNVKKIKYVLPKDSKEYRQQKLFYEDLGFHIDNINNTHEMWLSLEH